MTLNDYLKAFRQRWLVIALCTLVASAVMWVVTPAKTDAIQARSYTATATLLVGGSGDVNTQLGRIALFLTTGEIPKRAAARLGYEGDPAVLAKELTVTPDFIAAALTVSATAPKGERAAAVANAFANEAVASLKQRRLGTESVSVSILQAATPIPNSTGGGFVVPPSRPARTALAAVLGLLLGLALALVLDRLDSRLRSRAEVAAALGLPIIAEVPRLGRTKRHGARIGVTEEPLSPYADAYRGARTAIDHTPGSALGRGVSGVDSYGHRARGEQGARIVLVTSAHPSEGKTTTVANLAASFAESGQRVLVLDADLRSPGTHTLFDVPQGAGISDYLSRPDDYLNRGDDSALESLIRPTSVPGVRIMTAGTRLAHPASLASLMGGLLAEARELADVVIIDTAPLLVASDVFDLLPLVDTVLVVVRHGRITGTVGERVAELLGRFQVPVSGVVIVGAPAKGSGRYGYGSGYGSGYGAQSSRSKRRDRPRGRDSASTPRRTDEAPLAVSGSRRDRRTSSST